MATIFLQKRRRHAVKGQYQEMRHTPGSTRASMRSAAIAAQETKVAGDMHDLLQELQAGLKRKG